MKRIVIAGWCLCAAVSGLADVIRGSYSYTYGDRENLVEARKTCNRMFWLTGKNGVGKTALLAKFTRDVQRVFTT